MLAARNCKCKSRVLGLCIQTLNFTFINHEVTSHSFAMHVKGIDSKTCGAISPTIHPDVHRWRRLLLTCKQHVTSHSWQCMQEGHRYPVGVTQVSPTIQPIYKHFRLPTSLSLSLHGKTLLSKKKTLHSGRHSSLKFTLAAVGPGTQKRTHR